MIFLSIIIAILLTIGYGFIMFSAIGIVIIGTIEGVIDEQKRKKEYDGITYNVHKIENYEYIKENKLCTQTEINKKNNQTFHVDYEQFLYNNKEKGDDSK